MFIFSIYGCINHTNQQKSISKNIKLIADTLITSTQLKNNFTSSIKEIKNVFHELEIKNDSTSFAFLLSKLDTVFQSNYTLEKDIQSIISIYQLDKQKTSFDFNKFYYNCIIGDIYLEIIAYDSAAIYYNKALYYEDNFLSDSLSEILGNRNLEMLYGYTNNFTKQIYYGKKLIQLSNEPEIYFKIGGNIARSFAELNELDSAIIYYYKYAVNNNFNKNKTQLAKQNEDIGALYFKQGNYDSTEFYYLKALAIQKETNKVRYNLISNIANFYGMVGRFDEAKKYADECMQLAIKDSLDIRKKMYSHLLYVDIYRETKEYEKGYPHYDAYSTLQQAVFDTSIAKQHEELEVKYNVQTKENKIKNLEIQKKNQLQKIKNRNRFIFLFIVLSFIAALAYYLYQSRKQLKLTIEKLNFEQQLLRSQMNPHFIFNAIAGIRGNILNNENEIAIKYLTAFSKFTRQTLELSREKTISLQDEINTLKNYIDLQLMRFNHSFDVDFIIDENIQTEEIILPPMLLQPFVENAIEHGLKGLNYKGKLTIKINLLDQKMLLIKIIDNGKGFGQSAQDEVQLMKKQSVSTDITKKRLDIWSRETKTDSYIEVLDRKMKNEKGTEAIIFLGIKYN